VGSYALPLRMRTKVRAFEARIDGMSRGRRSPLPVAMHWQTTEAAEARRAHCGGFICARDFPVTAVTAMWRAPLPIYVCGDCGNSGRSMKGHSTFLRTKATKDDKVVVAWLCHGYFLLSTTLQRYKMAIHPRRQ
jgi:hypothetical protein